jgi:hypothetical protein
LICVRRTGARAGAACSGASFPTSNPDRRVRAVVRIVVPILALLLVAPVAVAEARNASRPLVVRPKWRLVVRTGLQYVTASDRYVAILQDSGNSRLTLIDEQTHRRTALSPPNCAYVSPYSPQVVLGGPWLLVACNGNGPSPRTYDLYDLRSGRWAPFEISPQCQGRCEPVAIGRYWAKIVSDDGVMMMYTPSDYYLQNLATGQFIHDPATPGGTVFDDLDAPSGSTPLCSPLRYPSVQSHDGPTLGSLSFYGQFALTSGGPDSPTTRLRRCGSNMNLLVPEAPDASAPGFVETGPVALSRAVIGIDDLTLHGWFLPSLQRFTIRPALRDYIEPVAVTSRTIYVATLTRRQLWAATLPSPQHRSRH